MSRRINVWIAVAFSAHPAHAQARKAYLATRARDVNGIGAD